MITQFKKSIRVKRTIVKPYSVLTIGVPKEYNSEYNYVKTTQGNN